MTTSLVQFFFRAPEAVPATAEVIRWWEARRPVYNLAVGVAGLVSLVSLMALQAMSMSYALGRFGDAARINIVYALRGLWAVALAWLLARTFGGAEARHSVTIMLLRLAGAVLLTLSVIVALSAG